MNLKFGQYSLKISSPDSGESKLSVFGGGVIFRIGLTVRISGIPFAFPNAKKQYEYGSYYELLISEYCVTCIQGPPSGFDTKYLALADRNMQVTFGLKVVWES